MAIAGNGYQYEPSDWREASKREPCPICEKPDWCSLTGPEGAIEAVVCMRVESDNRRKNGGHLHRLRDSDDFLRTSPPRRNGAPRSSKPSPKKSEPKGEAYGSEDLVLAELQRQHGVPSATWTYRNADGEAVGLVVRWNQADDKKDIRPASRHADGWRIGGMPAPRPLYALPDLNASDETAYIVEGEKAADAGRSIGLTCTTSPHGSKSADKADWTPLAGRDVVILPDHDQPGEKYLADVVSLLAQLSPAPTVQVLRLNTLPGGDPMPDGGDLADWIDAHGDSATPEVIAANLAELVATADTIDLTESRPAAPPSYQPFPTSLLPEPARGFVAAAAKAIGCDASFLALPLLAALGAAIGTTRRLRLLNTWSAPAILWTAIVGESGTSKSPAFKLVMKPLRDLQREAFARNEEAEQAYQGELAIHEKDVARWKKDKNTSEPPPAKPDLPRAERLVVSDTTIEALAPLLQQNPRGLLLARDELSGWIGSFDRYSGGRGSADAAHWLSMYNGEEIIVDRKTGTPRTIYVPEAAVWVTGGIQPAILHRALGVEHRESGLAARLLLACPPRKAKRWTEADVSPAAQEELAQVFRRLCELSPAVDEMGGTHPAVLSLTTDAKALWINYYNAHSQEQAELSGDLAAAWSKLEECAARLALVIHLTRWAYGDLAHDGSEDNVIDAESMAAGIGLAEWFKGEAQRVYGVLGESDEDRERRRLVEWIGRKGGLVTAREVQQGRRDCKTAADAEAVLEDLVKAGRGAWMLESTATNQKRLFVLPTASTSTHSPKTR